MRKFTFALIICVFTISMQAQTQTNVPIPYLGIESQTDLNLTKEQIAKIKKLNSEIGPKFAEIGKDSSLSGREKGQKKRALALKHKADIQSILTANQIALWEKKYGKMSDDKGIKDNMTDNYDTRLKALERKYEKDKEAIEDNDSLSKDVKKARKKALKEAYKIEKEKLKAEKDNVKESILLNR